MYRYENSAWVFKQKLVASDPEHDMDFGCSLDIDGDIMVVGAEDRTVFVDEQPFYQAGVAYIFKLNGSTSKWEEAAKLAASDPGTNHNFGVSVAVSTEGREKFLIGASRRDSDEGAVYYFDPLAFDCNDNGLYDACECIEDLNEDDKVNIDDLFFVLGVWGPCDGCCADFDHNGFVDIDDLFHILVSWGPCADKGSGTPPQSIYDCLEYIGDPEDFQTCIEAMILIGSQ